MKKRRCKARMAVLTVLAALLTGGTAARADNVPYQAYSYTLGGDAIELHAPYRVGDTIVQFGEGETFSDPQDMVYYDGRLYVADTGHNRVVALNPHGELLWKLERFDNGGETDALLAPAGVCATGDGLYVSDTGNSRILKFDHSGRLLQVFTRPDFPGLDASTAYSPRRLAVDYAGRLYVICEGINRGVLQLNADGSFFSFLGAPKVSYTLYELFLRSVATEEQLDKMEKFVPTEYSSLCIDAKGFLYVTSSSASVKAIGRLNTVGENILKYPDGHPPQGDLNEAGTAASQLVDIAYSGDGLYAVLDLAQGRVFTYDEYGYLLYAFGGLGDADGLSRSPSALEYIGERLAVLDAFNNKLTIYTPTELGESIQMAIANYRNGHYDAAYTYFQQTLALASNYSYAQIGTAKINIQRGEYAQAMTLLRAAGEKTYYSIAFREQRKSLLKRAFLPALLGAALLAALGIARHIWRRKHPRRLRREARLLGQLRYGLYGMFHPFDGFWDLKHEKRGGLLAAGLLFGLLLAEYGLGQIFCGYLLRTASSAAVRDTAILALTVLLWCVSNWSFTTLMDGKGKFSDIFMATVYACMPYILTKPFMILLSYLFTAEESTFYYVVQGLLLVWIGGLLLAGMMMIHDYTPSKMLLTALLTVLGMAVIIFLVLVFSNMLQMVIDFFFNIYKELSLRV